MSDVAEIDIDEALVLSLLREQHPDLADLGLRGTVTGWDNQLWRLGAELAVRLPRTERAPDLLRKEHRWLPVLAPRLSLPVPTPLRISEPSARFPRPWTIAAWVPGAPADRAAISRGDHAAEALAEFLAALHVRAPADAPVNPTRGLPLGTYAQGFTEGFERLASVGEIPSGVRDIWQDALSAPEAAGPPLWLHGDLHPANVVVSAGTLTGVLDFGELCAGDPATDLSAAWLLLPAGAASRFFDAYARAAEATVRRARGWAVLRAVGLIHIGRAGEQGLPGGKRTWGVAGRATLDRLLADR